MAIYDPKKLSFWEIERGTGPITKQRQIARTRENPRADEAPMRYSDSGFSNSVMGSLGDGNRWVSRGR